MTIRIGARFTRWKVISSAGRDKQGKRLYLCRCDCGTERDVRGFMLTLGRSKSCGCRKIENCAAFMVAGQKPANPNSKYKKPEYGVWCAMKDRCNRPKNKNYQHYGARGIRVHPDWERDFDAFFAYIGPRPSNKHSVERINNDGGYEPGNVKWATQTEQVHNRRAPRISHSV